MKFKCCMLAFLLGATLIFTTQSARSQPAPNASPETQQIITKMIAAHGGMEKWRSSPSISFHSHLKVNFGNGNWVPFWEEATVDPISRRAYAKLPNPDGTHGLIAFDGKQAWSAGNLQGISRAPARFTAWRNFYLFNLPWLTQDPGVNLGAPGKSKLPVLPKDPKEYLTIKLTFEPGAGDTPKDYYILYIDPDSYQLRASEYVMTYASMMQGGAEASPPSVFVWEKTETVEGFIVPARYTVYWKDGSVAVKDGEVSHWSFQQPFEAARLTMPTAGTRDESNPNRE